MSFMGCILPAAFYFRFAKAGIRGYELASAKGGLVMFTGVLGVVGMISGTYMSFLELIK